MMVVMVLVIMVIVLVIVSVDAGDGVGDTDNAGGDASIGAVDGDAGASLVMQVPTLSKEIQRFIVHAPIV